ncbi:sigma factor-like helix-turn-helix DNA-binding protein [Streptomyces sp. NBC_01092]|uniref:sigma factor-like helix-turn-helix DNA-binding protein n=1 Tax=Streptomyces sp. NBC_01092 TaxID=2903748 RepID=UPI003868EBF2|nr:sigma-70 region 4 domain-containing protein [Streptomyces sp. NBC_01092]
MPQADGPDRAAPGDEYGQVDSRDQLVRALQQLPMRMRTVVVLRYFHDLSDAEIAADLDISPSTVATSVAGGSNPASNLSSTVTKSDAATLLYAFSDGQTLPIEGRHLEDAKAYLPGSVIAVDPHTPKPSAPATRST